MIICFELELGYNGPTDALIFLKNLFSVLVNTKIIDKNLSEDLVHRWVVEVNPERPFINSPLGLVPKHNGR